jgi:hypothetical protein
MPSESFRTCDLATRMLSHRNPFWVSLTQSYEQGTDLEQDVNMLQVHYEEVRITDTTFMNSFHRINEMSKVANLKHTPAPIRIRSVPDLCLSDSWL